MRKMIVGTMFFKTSHVVQDIIARKTVEGYKKRRFTE
jgi:hypothetical protein